MCAKWNTCFRDTAAELLRLSLLRLMELIEILESIVTFPYLVVNLFLSWCRIYFYPLPVVDVNSGETEMFAAGEKSRETPRGVVHNNCHVGIGDTRKYVETAHDGSIVTASQPPIQVHTGRDIGNFSVAFFSHFILKVALKTKSSLEVKGKIPPVVDTEGGRKWL